MRRGRASSPVQEAGILPVQRSAADEALSPDPTAAERFEAAEAESAPISEESAAIARITTAPRAIPLRATFGCYPLRLSSPPYRGDP